MELLSQLWSLLGLLTVLQNVLPSQLLTFLHSIWQSLQEALTPYSYFDVPEFLGSTAVDPNDLYHHIHLYLHHYLLNNPPSPPPRLTLSRPRSASPTSPLLSLLSPNHSLHHHYAGHRLLWTHHSDTLNDSLEERRSFSLRIPKRHATSLLHPYLTTISTVANNLERASSERRLHTNSGRFGGSPSWDSIPFHHPATFDTLALDPALKTSLLTDLSTFAAGGDFYHRTGRAWKRGYLLHGPPGSGKSSLIAAMANHLNYDIYDLELTHITDNSDLRTLLIQTTNRSIIVIEDIDCSLNLTGARETKHASFHKRKKRNTGIVREDDDDNDRTQGRVTLSGLLNFTDGLWSCCGEERIIVFTTNHMGKVDPALLRAGRMDMHVKLGVCGVQAMRELVERYVGITENELVTAAEELVAAGAGMTPADVGEVLLKNRCNPEVAVRELLAELQARVGGSCGESSEEREGAPEGSWEIVSPKKERARWEGKVRFLGRLKSLTKSDSGRRGV